MQQLLLVEELVTIQWDHVGSWMHRNSIVGWMLEMDAPAAQIFFSERSVSSREESRDRRMSAACMRVNSVVVIGNPEIVMVHTCRRDDYPENA